MKYFSTDLDSLVDVARGVCRGAEDEVGRDVDPGRVDHEGVGGDAGDGAADLVEGADPEPVHDACTCCCTCCT